MQLLCTKSREVRKKIDVNAKLLHYARMSCEAIFPLSTTTDTSSSSFLCSATASDLLRITEPGLNLCIWRRQIPAELDAALHALAQTERFQLHFAGWRAKLDVDRLLDPVVNLASDARGAWAADIAQLIARFCQAAGCERITVKLCTAARTDCPVFHTDYVPLRLLCTYIGAGTEYLAEADVQRVFLGHCAHCTAEEANERIMKAGATVHRMDTFAAAFCKGASWPDGRGRGLVHRSPPFMQGMTPRIKLTVDAA